jgi:carbonic anhydrase/acetyltransferase-like protein (isoleucine patch superfamily)
MTIEVRNKDSYYVVITGDVTNITIGDVKDVQNLVVIE